ncbi:MAG: hypothetical protein Q7T25_00410, partial [Sideroxyarcus sp.]|nr:hypothetical protein [Sideroxyarcus sp.]
WDVQDGLILVDEPLAALDPGLQFDLLDSLDMYAAERRHAVVAILHDINHAIAGFERLLLLKDGQLVGDLPADAAAVPALEALYGVALSAMTNVQGDLVVTPLRAQGWLKDHAKNHHKNQAMSRVPAQSHERRNTA